MLSVLAVAWGMGARARRQLVVSLAERTERAEAEQELRVSQGKLRERERIASEMHDVLSHRFSLLSMHAGALEFRPDAPSDEISKATGAIRASAYQSLVGLQVIIHVLREAGPEKDALCRPTNTKTSPNPIKPASSVDPGSAPWAPHSSCPHAGPHRLLPAAPTTVSPVTPNFSRSSRSQPHSEG